MAITVSEDTTYVEIAGLYQHGKYLQELPSNIQEAINEKFKDVDFDNVPVWHPDYFVTCLLSEWGYDEVKYFANEQGIDIDIDDDELVEKFINEQHELLGYDNGIFYLIW